MRLEIPFLVDGSCRRQWRASALPALAVLLVAGGASAAEAPLGAPAAQGPAPPPPRFSVGTSSVVLDVVVRDRKGNLVSDLVAADFEVREDGVRQPLESVRVVAATTSTAPPGGLRPAGGSQAASPRTDAPDPVLALVFDRMSATGRDLARRAATAYLASASGALMGVFAIDLALHSVQPYTRDRALILEAVEHATSYGHTSFASASTRTEARDQIDALAKADGRLAASAQATSAGGLGARATASLAGQTALAKAQAEVEVRLQRSLESLERTQQGYATLRGLQAVVASLARAPGRKTVLLFSEGLALPASVEPSFRALVASANEANVSVYGLEAGGLRAASPSAETGLEIRQAGERRLRQMQGAGDLAVEGSLMRQLERGEDLLRLDPRSGLGQLAEETGGFLIQDSNDAAAALRRIEEDMRFHYVLSYSPTNERFDGRFRRISVRVRHRGVTVRTRKGYVASPGSTWRSGR